MKTFGQLPIEKFMRTSELDQIQFNQSKLGISDSSILTGIKKSARFIVSRKAPLGAVCREMAYHGHEFALVVENDKVIGVLTWVDALKAIGDAFFENK